MYTISMKVSTTCQSISWIYHNKLAIQPKNWQVKPFPIRLLTKGTVSLYNIFWLALVWRLSMKSINQFKELSFHKSSKFKHLAHFARMVWTNISVNWKFLRLLQWVKNKNRLFIKITHALRLLLLKILETKAILLGRKNLLLTHQPQDAVRTQ